MNKIRHLVSPPLVPLLFSLTLPATAAAVLPAMAAADEADEAEQNGLAASGEEARAKLAEAREKLREAARQVAELSRELAHREPVGRGFFYAFDGGDFAKPRLGIVAGQAAGDGVRVISVTPHSPADEAGLASGDIIVKLDDKPLAGDNGAERLHDFIDRLKNSEEGAAVHITYRRDNKENVVEVTPRKLEGFAWTLPPLELAPLLEGLSESLPPIDFSAPQAFAFRMHRPGWPWRELELAELDSELGSYFGRDNGILVLSVPDSFANVLKRGDILIAIDGRELRGIDQAFRVFQSYEPGETIHLKVLRHERETEVTINAPEAKLPAAGGRRSARRQRGITT